MVVTVVHVQGEHNIITVVHVLELAVVRLTLLPIVYLRLIFRANWQRPWSGVYFMIRNYSTLLRNTFSKHSLYKYEKCQLNNPKIINYS